MTRDTKIGVWLGLGLLVLWAIVALAGCSFWVHEIEDPVLSGGTWDGWKTTTRPIQ